MRHVKFGDLELSVIDDNDADTKYIYDEIFGSQIYHHDKLRMPDNATIMDVGANIGIYSLWAHRRYRPKAIYCYEASPRTFAYLRDNTERLIDKAMTAVKPTNAAIASRAGETLTLHQSTKVSGISTLLDQRNVSWIEKAASGKQLEIHAVNSSTVSAEIAANKLAAVDMLKIDVEGYFMEVLKGIALGDFAKIKNIVAEVDYLPETGIRPDEFEKFLNAKGYTIDCLDRSQKNNLTYYAWRA